MNILPN